MKARGPAGRHRDRIVATLNDLIRSTDTVSRLVARGKNAYDSDEAMRLAAQVILHKIGEAVARLPDEFLRVRQILDRPLGL